LRAVHLQRRPPRVARTPPGLGIAALPDYMASEEEAHGMVRLLADVKAPKVDVYFVYPEELRTSKRVAVFRDFLLARLAQRN
jgi:DNA-binding transcriptional LysR family regulator